MLAIVFAHNGSDAFVASMQVDTRMEDTPTALFHLMIDKFKLPEDDVERILLVETDVHENVFVSKDFYHKDWTR